MNQLLCASEGRSSARALDKIAHGVAIKRTTEDPDLYPYQDDWEGLHVPAGTSKSLPLADGTRPERVLYFRPGDGHVQDFAIAHSIANKKVVRREILEVYRDPGTGKYELRGELQLVGADGKLVTGTREELETCLTCHSVSPEGKHLVQGKPTPVKFPELQEILYAPLPRDLPRWPGVR